MELQLFGKLGTCNTRQTITNNKHIICNIKTYIVAPDERKCRRAKQKQKQKEF